MPGDLWYLGTPYTRYPHGLDAAAAEAARNAGLLIRAGVNAYSPIVHGHAVARAAMLDPLDAALWMMLNEPVMAVAHGLIVCMMDGWHGSAGLRAEIRAFELAGKRIVYMVPGSASAALLERLNACPPE
jgi:hypothetical protein